MCLRMVLLQVFLWIAYNIMWEAHIEGDIRHVWPNDESHDTHSFECECNPISSVCEAGHIIVVHNSFDGREHIERLVDNNPISKN